MSGEPPIEVRIRRHRFSLPNRDRFNGFVAGCALLLALWWYYEHAGSMWAGLSAHGVHPLLALLVLAGTFVGIVAIVLFVCAIMLENKWLRRGLYGALWLFGSIEIWSFVADISDRIWAVGAVVLFTLLCFGARAWVRGETVREADII